MTQVIHSQDKSDNCLLILTLLCLSNSKATCLGADDSSVSGGALVKAVGHEELNSSASLSFSPSFRSSGTGSAAPSPFILQKTQKGW